MKIPKKVICELGNQVCEVDGKGWGSCGDAIQERDGTLCLWLDKVTDWQEIEPRELLEGDKDDTP